MRRLSSDSNKKQAEVDSAIDINRKKAMPLSISSGHQELSPNSGAEDGANDSSKTPGAGTLEKLKQQEAELARLLSSIRREKQSALRSRPLSIGVVGFGRFGQFIARTFAKYGRVVVTSRSDYTDDVASDMGAKYVPLSDPSAFLAEKLDVIVFANSIMSFEETIREFEPHIQNYVREMSGEILPGPLLVDVLSVKEHPRQVLLDLLPKDCDILCTHPMFGPDSGKNGWKGLTFVYERTRINGVTLDPAHGRSFHQMTEEDIDLGNDDAGSFVKPESGTVHDIQERSEAHVEGMDRMERFLGIWEEEGCHMVAMSCADHDAYAANSQFITHLMGRILGSQGLGPTPIDTKGFESVLKLVGNTMADSFELFYGLYKYNKNSADTVRKLQVALDAVVQSLREKEESDNEWVGKMDLQAGPDLVLLTEKEEFFMDLMAKIVKPGKIDQKV